ncbi:protein PSK SIMULATOR 1-like [Curcuma longa]|uniref:protein PSK SIMULATOR 1-like n=1 Tax=Curcuma longa TaxID=136217 RepID=UPI003D9E934D
MARLVSLHRTLADDHFLPLCDNMRSLGVANFFSTDQSFLLRLALAELVADLDTVAATVARFSLKCRDPLLRGFDRFYGSVKAAALRHGRVADLDRLGLGSMVKSAAKSIKKMEKYVVSTSLLHEELLKLEESEKAQDSAQFLKQRKHGTALEAQRFNVRGLKERSLWSWTFDEVVQPMAGAVFAALARIYDVFGPQILCWPLLPPARNHDRIQLLPGTGLNFFNTLSSRMFDRPSSAAKDVPITIEKLPSLEAWPNTVGGSGLSFHYAELIVIAVSLFARWELDNAVDAGLTAMRQIETAVGLNDVLCNKMTPSMRCTVRAKLKEIRRRKKNGRAEMSSMETDWWRNELERILGWLGPVARNTRRWEEEHSEERFLVGPRVLLSQTLHFADRNLTATAIVHVFVGLNCLLLVPYEQTQ